MAELEGKVAVVTGGSRGIGRAIALALARDGADVALAARGTEDLAQVAKEVEVEGRRALSVPTDVSNPQQVGQRFERVTGELGPVDILVNNAGGAPFLSAVATIREDGF